MVTCERLSYGMLLSDVATLFERTGKDSERLDDIRIEIDDAHGCQRFRQRFRRNNTQTHR
jgi:hypothetical protein